MSTAAYVKGLHFPRFSTIVCIHILTVFFLLKQVLVLPYDLRKIYPKKYYEKPVHALQNNLTWAHFDA